jgi:hypothetical protein
MCIMYLYLLKRAVWLGETGIVDHIQVLKGDEARTAIAILPPGDARDLRVIVDAIESL